MKVFVVIGDYGSLDDWCSDPIAVSDSIDKAKQFIIDYIKDMKAKKALAPCYDINDDSMTDNQRDKYYEWERENSEAASFLKCEIKEMELI